jgi:fluoride ion exporter CrcB/FEX
MLTCHSEAQPKNLGSHFAKFGEMGVLSNDTTFSNAIVEILHFVQNDSPANIVLLTSNTI